VKPGTLRRAALVALPLAGLLELGAQVWTSRRAPSFDAWLALRAPIAERKRAGEPVVVAPSWAEPLARRALGDDLMPLRDVARPDVTRYATALELSILGERSPELAGFREESREALGKFVLRRVANPSPAVVRYDFVDHAHPPDADVRGTDPPVSCAWNPRAAPSSGGLGGHPTFPSQRFECPGGEYFNVGVTVIADQDFRPRRCLWSHPFARGEIVTRFHDVPLGRVIRGHGGMYWITEREKRGVPVTLTVRVDGDTIGTYVHADGDGWSSFELPLGAHANAEHAEVELAVSASNNVHRHFCFEADTR
jgi:hypothetical protein